MEHKHSVYDTDTHFVIDKDTREIKLETETSPVIVQHDHNSERFTFRLPRHIDSHDTTLCNEIQVHYLNIDADTKETAKGVYTVDDIGVLDEDESKAVCSWLISENATRFAGRLNFMIRFACIADDGTVLYRWNTGIYTDLTVASGYDNGEAVTEDFPDILAQWKAELFGIGDTEEQRIKDASAAQQAAIAAKGEAVNASIPADYFALSALADQNRRNKAGAIVLDAEGESIVLNDASEYPLMGLKVFGNSTQNGEPSPEYPQEINSVENAVVMVCGKNLLNSDLMINEQYVKNADGTYTITKNGTGSLRFSNRAVCSIPKGTYILSVGSVTGFDDTVRIALTFASGKEMSCAVTPTIPKVVVADEEIVKIAAYIPADRDNGAYTTMNNLMLKHASEATDYEPYKEPQTVTIPHTLPGIPVSSGGNYTDANGKQWICDEVDLARGVYVQRVKRLVLDGSETWRKSDSYLYIDLEEHAIKGGKGFCSHFVFWYNYGGDCIFASEKWVYLGSVVSANYDVDTWKAFLSANNVTLLYILATPSETPLSDAEITAFKALHSNKPNTTILNDAGAYMTVEYVADTKTYIDNKIAALIRGD